MPEPCTAEQLEGERVTDGDKCFNLHLILEESYHNRIKLKIEEHEIE